jgi:mannosyl-oligosaccharide alpha-1,2-mannosidase
MNVAQMKTERDAMGADEYHPISHKGSNLTEEGGIGYTVVDAIDTILLMGLDGEYLRARSWIEHKLSFDRDAPFSTFEVWFFFELLHVAYSTMDCDLIHSERCRLQSAFSVAFSLPTTTPGAIRSS